MTLDRLRDFINDLHTDEVIVQGRIVIGDKAIFTHYNKKAAMGNFFSTAEREEITAALKDKETFNSFFFGYDLDNVSISGGYDENNTHSEQYGDGLYTISFSLTLE